MPEPYSKKSLDIWTLKHLEKRLGIPLDELERIASKTNSLYYFEEISKGNGKIRLLSKPSRPLKRIQKRIHKLLQEIKISDSAHCGIKKRSNLTNAEVHVNKKEILSFDFKDFYPNISHHRIYHLFRHELNCSPEVASLLTKLCTIRDQVPQGGCMSTDLANLVCRKLDARLKGLSKAFGIDYTRFNDDIYFSGDNIPENFIRKAKKIIMENGFNLNQEKESLRGKDQHQIVTKLTVNRKKPIVPREKKREWRAEKHNFEKHESETLSPEMQEKRQRTIQGRQSYIDYIEQPPTL